MKSNLYKRLFSAACAVMAVICLTVAACAAEASVTGNGVRFRSEPNTSSKIITTLSRGTKLTVNKKVGNFYAASYNGKQGYISADYTEITASAAVVSGNGVNVREGAGTSYRKLAALPKGTSITVLSAKNGWCHVQYAGGSGYMSADYITYQLEEVPAASVVPAEAPTEPAEYYVSGNGVRFRTAPSTKGDIITTLPYGTVVLVLSSENGWSSIQWNRQKGYMSSEYLKKATPAVDSAGGEASLIEKIVGLAKANAGVKYTYGGADPSGFDCSGLVYYVFKQNGITLPRRASEQYAETTHIDRKDLKYGDLVFFVAPGYSTIQHVGIYLSDGDFIHATHPCGVVQTDTMLSGYYDTNFYGCSRVVH